MIPGNELLAPDDEIEVVEDNTPAPSTVVHTGQPAKDDDELASLKATVTEANQRTSDEIQKRQDAERQRDEARGRIASEIDARFASNEVAITNALAAYSQQETSLKADYAGALQRGDHARAADLMEAMADVKANKMAATRQQRDLAQDKAQYARQAEEASKRPADALANVSQPTKKWFAKNPTFAPDTPGFAKALEADSLAIRARLKPDSPEYFDFVDTHLGLKAAPEAVETPKPAPRQAMPAAAPPSRGNGQGAPKAPTKITLTAREREVAVAMPSLGKTEDERIRAYALNKQQLQKEGRL